jgi:hypothetical protein
MLLDFCIVVAVLALAWFAPAVPRRLGRALRTLAGPALRWPFAAVAAVAALPLVVRALLLPVLPIPRPRIHDEFSIFSPGIPSRMAASPIQRIRYGRFLKVFTCSPSRATCRNIRPRKACSSPPGKSCSAIHGGVSS